MVKSVLGVSHRGLREWVIQRISAILMAIYFIGLMAYFLWHPGLTFEEWHGLFAEWPVKIVTIIFVLSLLYHAWIGMWTIFTDYVQSPLVRAILNTLVLLMLVACFFWGLLLLWSL